MGIWDRIKRAGIQTAENNEETTGSQRFRDTVAEANANPEQATKIYLDAAKDRAKETAAVVAIPLAGGAAGPVVADLTTGAFVADGLYNLASGNGVQKTYNHIKNGEWSDAARSAGGDLLNLAMVYPGLRLGKSLVNGYRASGSLRNAYTSDLVAGELAKMNPTVEVVKEVPVVKEATTSTKITPTRSVRAISTEERMGVPKVERNQPIKDNEPFRKQLIENYNNWIKKFNDAIIKQRELDTYYGFEPSNIPEYKAIPNDASIKDAIATIKTTLNRHNSYFRGVQPSYSPEDIALVKNLSPDEALKYAATHPRLNNVLFMTPEMNAFIYGGNGKTALIKRKFNLGKNPLKWIDEGDFKIKLFQEGDSHIKTDIVDPWNTRNNTFNANELYTESPMEFVNWVPDYDRGLTSLNFKKGGILKGQNSVKLEEPVDTTRLKYLVDKVNKTSSANFVKRLKDKNRKFIINNDGTISTHLLGWEFDENGNAIIFPEVQQQGDSLVKFSFPESYYRAVEKGDTLRMNAKDADLFTKHYKLMYPEFIPNK